MVFVPSNLVPATMDAVPPRSTPLPLYLAFDWLLISSQAHRIFELTHQARDELSAAAPSTTASSSQLPVQNFRQMPPKSSAARPITTFNSGSILSFRHPPSSPRL